MEATPPHPQAPAIELREVTKTYPDGTTAVDRISLSVRRGEVCCLVGPSGCGKSTTLRLINRLIEPTSGTILLDGVDVTTADPVTLRRSIGYVIQQVGLFPHQTIARNVATVPHLLGWSRADIDARVATLLSLVGLDPATYADRYPHQLSGGQRQRVGVARALAADPPVLLMDEPFGAVDPVVRVRLQDEFAALQRKLHITVVLVTHDIDEAVALGDQVAVLDNSGRVAQVGTPLELLARPVSPFVADFVGATTSLRRLSVSEVTAAYVEPSEPAPDQTPPDHLGEGVRLGESLQVALTRLLAGDRPSLPVYDADGAVIGHLTAAGIHRTLRAALAVTPGSALPAGGATDHERGTEQ